MLSLSTTVWYKNMNLHQDHVEMAGSSVIVFLGVGALVHWLAAQEHWLASVSYMLGATAALVNIYFKFRNRGK